MKKKNDAKIVTADGGLRTSNKMSDAVQVVDDGVGASTLGTLPEKTNKEEKANNNDEKKKNSGDDLSVRMAAIMVEDAEARKRGIVLPKMLCSVGWFVACMMASAIYRNVMHGVPGDGVLYGYLALWAVTAFGLLSIWKSRKLEEAMMELYDLIDNRGSAAQAFAMSVICMDEFRDEIVQRSVVLRAFSAPDFSIVLRPYITCDMLIVECAICRIASNEYWTLLPSGIPWAEYRAMDEERRQREVTQRLVNCFTAFRC